MRGDAITGKSHFDSLPYKIFNRSFPVAEGTVAMVVGEVIHIVFFEGGRLFLSYKYSLAICVEIAGTYNLYYICTNIRIGLNKTKRNLPKANSFLRRKREYLFVGRLPLVQVFKK